MLAEGAHENMRALSDALLPRLQAKRGTSRISGDALQVWLRNGMKWAYMVLAGK